MWKDKAIFLGLTGLALSACTVGPDYQPPNVPTPKQWAEPTPASDKAESAQDKQQQKQWWRRFEDKRLEELVDRALQDNPDLHASLARLAAARAQTSEIAAMLWPMLDARGGYQRVRISPNTLKALFNTVQEGGTGLNNNSLLNAIGPLGKPFNLFQAGFDSSWELDLFGGVRRQQEASVAAAQALLEANQGIQLTLAAEVARYYVALIATQKRLDLAQLRFDNQQKFNRLAQSAYLEGLASALEVRQSQAEEDKAASAIPPLQAQLEKLYHALDVLTGRAPGHLKQESSAFPRELPIPPAIPHAMPSDVLRRRPDIRQAERELAAATALIGAATAELFPKITLSGAVGLQSTELSNFVNSSSGFYGFGPRLSLPIFQAGRLQANLEAHQAKAEEALKHYESTVLSAFREVNDSLSDLNNEQTHQQTLQASAKSRKEAARAAEAFFIEGETDLQKVLDTNRDWIDAEDEFVLSQLAWVTGHVMLYKSLGGAYGGTGAAASSLSQAEASPLSKP